MDLKPGIKIISNSKEELIMIQLILQFYGYYHPNFKDTINVSSYRLNQLNILILEDNEFYFVDKKRHNKLSISFNDFLEMDK